MREPDRSVEWAMVIVGIGFVVALVIVALTR